ncbi:hypothetical protein N24_0862 [Corynebacterium suranareeae]|uniref:Knr4/Smi1-like domain-containing protein n=1 Tax=Corynebacterium suranareeae TaxID=2506452 RepID=A0A160PP04_9CORY|nr:hypothetical protein N24_0862 [Corynebacterium suranareeae]
MDSQLDHVIFRPVDLDTKRLETPPITSEELAELHQLCAKGDTAYFTQPPISEQKAYELEKYLGYKIPSHLHALLRISNGAEIDFSIEGKILTGGWSVYSSSEIIKQHQTQGCSSSVAYDKGSPGVTQPRILHPGWIPFAHDYGGNVLGIDLVPGPNGVPGQILQYGREFHDGPVRCADSLIDFLAERRYPWPTKKVDHKVRPSTQGPFVRADVPDDTESLRLFNLNSFTVSAVLDLPLKSLLLRNIKTVDLEGIQHLPLQQLCLIDLENTDLSPLATHPTLRVVREENVEKLLNVKALGALPALETVALDSAEAADALGSVHSLELLRHLRLEKAVDLINRVSADDPLEISCVTGAF